MFLRERHRRQALKYDDASWHIEGEDEGLEGSCRTHIGVYLAWAIERDLVSAYHKSAHADAIAQVKAKQLKGSEFLYQYCADKLLSDDFNEAGKAFTDRYYTDGYIGMDYFDSADAIMDDLRNIYDVPDTWDLYAVVAESLDHEYAKYQEDIEK